MSTAEFLTAELAEAQTLDLEAALNPIEAEGTFRDSRECLALALIGGQGGLLLSPPTPRPKKV
ncbi:hypothetical protein ACLVWQ_04885 [Streptomyces sp. CWNU-52B]|uniref:hypothetical protein n=1 Tax=unclassified Streptomyces TaxID=2593676 RepID=UPI0039BEEC41